MIIKCKMCGGDLNIQEGNPICECEFCGTQQTIPQVDNEKKGNLFNRANRLRMGAEFDKAATVYASIVAEFPEEAEAYWGLCLCKYGIEYVDDPLTGNKIPTCHRTIPESILDDEDFDQACENASAEAKRLYREEAKAIDRLQQDILSIVANEEPYDVFICYKETDENGERTEDSVLAQSIYDELTSKELKVFFARITLEDKLGRQYEPYIYAALHSAKVMLSIGTQYEYFDSVWVKNEWARFLELMKIDRTKTLIPCYKGIDAYDMPREFKNLQAQDMGKIGWLQDLTRGIIKLCQKDGYQKKQEVVQHNSPQVANLLELVRTSLDSQNFTKAEEFCNQIISIDGSNYDAWKLKGEAISNQIENSSSRRKETCTCLERAYQLLDDQAGKEVKAKELIAILIAGIKKDIEYGMAEFKKERPKRDSFDKQKEAFSDSCNLLRMTCKGLSLDDKPYVKEIQNDFCRQCQQACNYQWEERVGYDYFRADLKTLGYSWNRDPNVDEFVSSDTFRPAGETLDRFCSSFPCLVGALEFCENQFNDSTPYETQEKVYSSLATYYQARKGACSYESMVRRTRDGNGRIIQERPFYRVDTYPKAVYQNEWDNKQRKYETRAQQAVEARKKHEKELADERIRVAREKAQKEAEEKKKRIELYWSEHPQEYDALEKRKQLLKDQISQIETEIKKNEDSEELAELKKQIESLTIKWSSLGIFKSKEKKALQEQINNLREQAKHVEEKIKGEIFRLNEKMSPIQKEFADVIDELERDRPSQDGTSVDQQESKTEPWTPDSQGFVNCPGCGNRMSVDFIRVRGKCPNCSCEYTAYKE